MKPVHAVAWMLVVMLGAGCPHAFGKGGTIDRAVLKDIIDNLRRDGCDTDDILEACGEDGYEQCEAECKKAGR